MVTRRLAVFVAAVLLVGAAFMGILIPATAGASAAQPLSIRFDAAGTARAKTRRSYVAGRPVAVDVVAAGPAHAFTITATSADGEVVQQPLAPDGGTHFRGELMLPRSGPWNVAVRSFALDDESVSPPVLVNVTDADVTTQATLLLAAAALAVLAGIALLAFVPRRATAAV